MTETIIPSDFDFDESVYKSPIAADNPSGEYLKYTELYDEITEAIKEDNPRLALGVWEKPLKKANWGKVKELSISALKEKSKDLQIASWLTLSLLKLNGFTGLATGLALLLELCLNFWDTIFPMPDGDDFETRLSPLYWIDEKLYIQIKLTPITAYPLNGKHYTYESWETSNIKLKHNEESVNPVDVYLDYVEISNENFHNDLDKYINNSLSYLNALKEFLRSKSLSDFPHFVKLEETLEDIKTLNQFAVSHFEKIRKQKESSAAIVEEKENEANETGEELAATKQDTIFDNESAYRLLSKAANYLLKNQPDHPSGHIAMMAVELRNKSLKQSLVYNIKDEDKLQKIFNLLNI